MDFQGNWVDFIILAILAYFISEAWKYGFWIILADFLGFMLSMIIALRGYSWASDFLQTYFQLAPSIAKALGFLIIAGFSEAIVSFLLTGFVKKIPYKFWTKPWNELAAVFPAVGQGLVILSFLLILIISLPIAPTIKKSATDSKIGGFLIQKTSGLEARLN